MILLTLSEAKEKINIKVNLLLEKDIIRLLRLVYPNAYNIDYTSAEYADEVKKDIIINE